MPDGFLGGERVEYGGGFLPSPLAGGGERSWRVDEAGEQIFTPYEIHQLDEATRLRLLAGLRERARLGKATPVDMDLAESFRKVGRTEVERSLGGEAGDFLQQASQRKANMAELNKAQESLATIESVLGDPNRELSPLTRQVGEQEAEFARTKMKELAPKVFLPTAPIEQDVAVANRYNQLLSAGLPPKIAAQRLAGISEAEQKSLAEQAKEMRESRKSAEDFQRDLIKKGFDQRHAERLALMREQGIEDRHLRTEERLTRQFENEFNLKVNKFKFDIGKESARAAKDLRDFEYKIAQDAQNLFFKRRADIRAQANLTDEMRDRALRRTEKDEKEAYERMKDARKEAADAVGQYFSGGRLSKEGAVAFGVSSIEEVLAEPARSLNNFARVAPMFDPLAASYILRAIGFRPAHISRFIGQVYAQESSGE